MAVPTAAQAEGPPPLSLPAASALTRLCSVFGLMPTIFATAAMLWPTMRTASIMNSCVYRALGSPMFPCRLHESHPLSKESIFAGKTAAPRIDRMPLLDRIHQLGGGASV